MRIIVPNKGLLYMTFDNAFYLGLALTKTSASYSKEFGRIRDKYGIAMGEPSPEGAPKEENDYRVGAYIVDYESYLRDEKVMKKIK